MHNPDDRTVWLTLTFDVTLHHVADLTDAKQQRRIGTNLQELTGVWDAYFPVGTAPTQRLGQALFNTPQIEAFLAPSAARPGARNLILFPEKLVEGSRVEFFNDETRRVERLKS